MEQFTANQLVKDRHNELRRIAGKRRTEARWLSATWRRFVSAN